MADLLQNSETDFCRIILFSARGAKLLVIPENGRLRLPALQVSRHQRIAKNLTASLQSEWCHEAVCLFRLDFTSIAPGPQYHVMESCEENPSQTRNSRWVSVSLLDEKQFPAADYVAVANSVAQCHDCAAGPFARLGWFSELREWARKEAAREGLTLSGRFRQLNASPTFSLLRFETNGPAIWFKAVGEPNLREYPITLALSRFFPTFLPSILATRADWAGWLSLEAPGAHPHADSGLSVWTKVAATLAELQIASMGRTLHLIDAGCRDLRACSLAESTGPFFEAMPELMELQTKPSLTPLSRQELVALGKRLQGFLADLRAIRIPNALGHLDVNPANIVVSNDRCVFLDWAEACVGHPFFTFEYLLEQLRGVGSIDARSRNQIVSAYTGPWKDFVEPAEMARSLAVTPALAVLAYAISIDAWRDPNQRSRPVIAKHLRSLCRRMKREADRCMDCEAHRNVPCPN